MLRSATEHDSPEMLFLVSLSRGGDARSWRLFRALGFREQGSPSWTAEIELPAPGVLRGRAEGPAICWLSDFAELPAEELACAYNEVFGDGEAVLSAQDVKAIVSRSDFLSEISLAWCDSPPDDVSGFLLASRRSGETAHIDCVGIRRSRRGRGYLESGFRAFCGRCRAAGFGRCTFVTGRPQVRKYAERRFGARTRDELVWLLRFGESRGAASTGAG
jgi:hypothetical protein